MMNLKELPLRKAVFEGLCLKEVVYTEPLISFGSVNILLEKLASRHIRYAFFIFPAKRCFITLARPMKWR